VDAISQIHATLYPSREQRNIAVAVFHFSASVGQVTHQKACSHS